MFCTTLAAMMLTTPTAQADSVVVGGVAFTIPSPVGFAPLTPQMKELYKADRLNVASNVERLGAYIPESEVGKALDDAVDFRTLHLDRTFQVQITKAITNAHLSSSDFTQLKKIITTGNEEAVRRAEREAPDALKNANDYTRYKYGATVELLGMMALPIHEETDRSISYSMFQKVGVTDHVGSSATVIAVTRSFLYLNGKVLILDCYAEEDGLKWSRAALKRWADAIVAANSP
jgi:hypothetical protein